MTITSNIHVGLTAWAAGQTVAVGAGRSSSGKAYRATTAGTTGATAPSHTSGAVSDGGVTWQHLSAIDHAAIQAWWDGIVSPLSDHVIGQVWNHGEVATASNLLNTTARTTSATATITLTAVPGESLCDRDPLTTRLAYDPTKGVALRRTGNGAVLQNTTTDYVTISRLQIKNDGTGSTAVPVNMAFGSNCRLESCFLQVASTSSGSIGIQGKAVNCVFLTESTTAPLIITGTGTGLVNCLLVRPSNLAAAGTATQSPSGVRTLRNTAWFGFTAGPPGSNWTGSNNATDLSAGATNATTASLTSVPFTTATFVQPSNADPAAFDCRLPAGSALIDAGTADTVNIPGATGFFGTNRATWDIGPFEAAAPAPAASSDMMAAGFGGF